MNPRSLCGSAASPGLHFPAMTDQGERNLSSVPGLGAGPVMVIGGAEDKVRDKVILSRFAKFAGGAGRARRRHLDGVLAWRSGHGGLPGAVHRPGDRHGHRQYDPRIGTRPTTPRWRRRSGTPPGSTSPVGTSRGSRRWSAGTKLGDALFLAHDRGAVLAGTSAGASAMASHMVAFGNAGPTPKNRMVQLSAGLGILIGPGDRPAFRRARADRAPARPGGAVSLAARDRDRRGHLRRRVPAIRRCM